MYLSVNPECYVSWAFFISYKTRRNYNIVSISLIDLTLKCTLLAIINRNPYLICVDSIEDSRLHSECKRSTHPVTVLPRLTIPNIETVINYVVLAVAHKIHSFKWLEDICAVLLVFE